MERLFSATEEKDEELTSQVAKDIEDAKANGEVDTEELNYKSNGDGSVSITDKGNGEVTVAEQDGEGGYDLFPAQITEQIEGFLHPEGDGVTPGQQVGAPDEHVEEHPGLEAGVVESTPEERSAEVEAMEGPNGEGANQEGYCAGEGCEECKEFSVSTDNVVVQRIFSDQIFCERLFSEVIDSEETAVVGDLKIEKVPGEDAVIVTSKETGDQAKVDLGEEDMDVTELDSKNFSEEEEIVEGEGIEPDGEGIDEEVMLGGEQYNALHVVGLDPFNHQLVDAMEYDEESAQQLVAQLTEIGVEGCQIFPDPDSARDYAMQLLAGLGADEIGTPEQVEFSDHENVYTTRFYSDNTTYMVRLFSEAIADVDASQSTIEDAIENGDEIETDTEVITPIDASSAVIEDKDNGEYTKVTLDGDDMNLDPISEEEAEKLMSDLSLGEDRFYAETEEEYRYFSELAAEEEERDFSDIWTNEAETRFFSEHEEMTNYMQRLFSEEADQDEIEDAIESGEQIENDTEVITPVDAKTAIIEDKETGEFTKAEIVSDDNMNVVAISEDEADELTDGLAVEDKDEEENEEVEGEKEFSETVENTSVLADNPLLSKFFSDIQGSAQEGEDLIAQGQAMIEQGQAMIAEAEAAAQNGGGMKPSIEQVEDKAAAAIQAIQEMTEQAQQAIMEAKEAPVEGQQEDLREAQFSENNTETNTALTWLSGFMRK